MISGEKLKANYNVVYGDRENLRGNMQLGDLHRHIVKGGDNTSPAWMTMLRLSLQQIDVVALTPHNDASGYDKASRIRDRIDKLGGHHVELIRGAEVTAQSELFPGENRHLLFYGARNFGKIPVLKPITETIQAALAQEAVVSFPHPELGKNMSVTEKEVEAAVLFGVPFYIEVYNGGAAQIDRWRPLVEAHTHLPFVSAIEQKIPQIGSNKRAMDIAETYGLKGTAGTDFHGYEKNFVFYAFPEGMTIFEAVESDKGVVVVSHTVPLPHISNLIVGDIRGRSAERKLAERLERHGEVFVAA